MEYNLFSVVYLPNWCFISESLEWLIKSVFIKSTKLFLLILSFINSHSNVIVHPDERGLSTMISSIG